MDTTTKLFILSNQQILEGSEEEIKRFRDDLLAQGQISWILTIN